MKKIDLNSSVSARIRSLMECEHLSISAMARSIGVNRSYFSKMLHGDRNFPVHVIFSISEIYCVTVDWLCCRSDSPKSCRHQKGEFLNGKGA